MERVFKKLDKRIDVCIFISFMLILTGFIFGYLDHKFAYCLWGASMLPFYIANAILKIKKDIEYEVNHFGN